MRRRLSGERLLSHLALALSVVLISTALASASLGADTPTPVIPTTEENRAAPVQPTATDASLLAARPVALGLPAERFEGAVSSRGAVPTQAPSPTSTPSAESPLSVAADGATPEPVAVLSSPRDAAHSQSDSLRVGIQAGHWKNSELPAELASLRGSTGAVGNGWKEVDVNLDVASRVAGILREKGVQVDLIPATVPVDYQADAFVALHGDANGNPSVSGFKLARARWSKIPQKDDALIQAISAEYQAATGLREHPSTITENMRQYYAFDWKDLKHAVNPATPAVILEMGFLTTTSDRQLLLEQPDRVAQGIARGILKFLGR